MPACVNDLYSMNKLSQISPHIRFNPESFKFIYLFDGFVCRIRRSLAHTSIAHMQGKANLGISSEEERIIMNHKNYYYHIILGDVFLFLRVELILNTIQK